MGEDSSREGVVFKRGAKAKCCNLGWKMELAFVIVASHAWMNKDLYGGV